ncbi:MAG: zf-HC2 domain-containing protein, partial [Bacteroidales bacterium]|nr:zf-HC2 domain-containing protein [Bacteroidales bacterium]
MKNNKRACSDIEHLLYLRDDELNHAEKTLLNEHLENCQSCSALRVNIMLNLPDIIPKTHISPDMKEAIKGMVT